ncbi:MAG: HAMP domain-containing histidine kinase [Caloramator sp.]|nr:HAMP domain-containing histidine kinase [Caloramator sp.]
MKSIKIKNKIFIQLIIALIVSILVSTLYLVVLGNIINLYIVKNANKIQVSMFTILGLILIIGSILSFIITFFVLVSKRVKYIIYLSEKIEEISSGKVGEMVEIKGNDEISLLAKHINNMSVNLKNMFERERQEEKIKNDLIVGLAHDLKTPLTTLIGYLELLQRMDTNLAFENNKYVNLAYNAAIKIKIIINDLFDYAKLSSIDFKLNKQEINLPTLILQIFEEYKPLFENKNLSLECEIEDYDINVLIDVSQFIRVLDNLISNAYKYSEHNSNVTIRLSKKENIELTITNTCKDLKIDTELMFQKFYKGDFSRSKGGSGLGLAIAKRIIELHGGDIKAQKQEDRLSIKITL